MRTTWEDYHVPAETAGLYEPTEIINYGSDPIFQTIHLNVPKNKKNVPLVIFFHGGGMTESGRECPTAVYNGNFAVAEPRYRLSPAHKAPAQMEDATAAVAWCFNHAEEYGIDRTRIFVGGMSAGCYLAAIIAMNTKFLAPYGLDYHNIAGLLLISGQMTTHFHVKQDLGKDNGACNPVIDEYAPLGNLRPDLPPVLLVTGESGLDMAARPEENAFMAASLRAIGHKMIWYYSLPGHDHGQSLESSDVLVMKFINAVLNNMKK